MLDSICRKFVLAFIDRTGLRPYNTPEFKAAFKASPECASFRAEANAL